MFTSKALRATSKHALVLTLPLAALVIVASIRALLTPDFYVRETADWAVQSSAQDIVNLFIVVPFLVLSGLYVHRGERLAEPIWGGTSLYLIYTFIIYCFNVHFNQLFLIYVGALSLSGWSFIYFVRHQHRMATVRSLSSPAAAKTIAIYFIIIATSFCLLWLRDILGVLWSGEPSPSMVAAGLWTNPVHILDLSFVLPGIFMTGLLLYRQQPIGMMFAPVVLVFFILMDITIAIIFIAQQPAGSYSNIPGVMLMSLLAIWSLVALLWLLRRSEG